MKKDWMETEQAALQLGITPRQLLKLRSKGIFKAGKHWRKKNPIAARPTYIWHVEKCSKILE
ncbi:MAG: hypothetical protein NW214_04215 [Pseudanabaenaceae cyanobacterium bins.39]|nr:hypothetical protein [Pseudanabaenaceae cyanobacterium bins.39]